MYTAALSTLTACLTLCFSTAWGQTNACDLTGDKVVNTADVQAAINMSLGISPCTANIVGAGVCNAEVVQRVINAYLGGGCLTSIGLHVVSLTWTASTSPGVVGYQVCRGTNSGGPYKVLASVGRVTAYTDTTVLSGTTYYYVLKAVDGSNKLSSYSSEVQAVIPIP